MYDILIIAIILSQVAWGTWNPVWIREDHLVRLNTFEWPIVNEYREGKVKENPEILYGEGSEKEHETVS